MQFSKYKSADDYLSNSIVIHFYVHIYYYSALGSISERDIADKMKPLIEEYFLCITLFQYYKTQLLIIFIHMNTVSVSSGKFEEKAYIKFILFDDFFSTSVVFHY